MVEMLGTFPPAGRNDENDISSWVKSEDTVGVGTMRVVRVSATSPYMSIIKYYKSGASITKGAALIHDATVSRDPNILYKATTTRLGMLAAGIAAAAVSNTSYFSWAYIWGYCPSAIVGTAVASGLALTIAGTNNGLGALSECTMSATANTGVKTPFAYNLWANADAATLSSIIITQMLG